jgi:AcrR family transcriptional regulator
VTDTAAHEVRDAYGTVLNGRSDAPRRILERTIEVIEQGGEAAVRTNIIAGECGVTAPVLYRAFESREGLIVAAQAERYRRSSFDVRQVLIDGIREATSREHLRRRMREVGEFGLTPARSRNRRIRADVIGSAVSRPLLRAAMVQVDREYVAGLVEALREAQSRGWIRPKASLEAVITWVLTVTTARVSIEFDEESTIGDEWNRLTLDALIDAILGPD